MIKTLVRAYEIAWTVAIPAVISFTKAKDGWRERLILKEKGPFDIWIHGASVGEAYMAADIISNIDIPKVLVTTNTPQGREILEKQLGKEKVLIRYFPFDIPSIMEKAIRKWNPKLMILLETELWPGLMYACNINKVPVIIINGRLTEKSLKSHMRFKSFWRKNSPEMIYAISKQDAERYGLLFGKEKIRLMNNIKFDRVKIKTNKNSWLSNVIPEKAPFIVFGSIRKEEEEDILAVIRVILSVSPDITIGLFPRHMERINWWKKRLYKKGIKWALRSKINFTISTGTVILWDRFGELEEAYSRADAVFVGGSLKPCGGHNFLEALSCGVIPCVGPFLDNFRWIDKELFDMGLVIIVKDWKELAEKLLYQLITPLNRENIRRRFERFIQTKKGGIKKACEIILSYLNYGGEKI